MRKHVILFVSALLCAASVANAIPAPRDPIPYTQPDGTVIMIVKHGDEWNHWVSDRSGNMLVMDEKGFFRQATAQQKAAQQAASRAAVEKRFKINELRKASAAASGDMTHGARRIPVVLLEFTDKSFSSAYSTNDPKTAFSNLLNQAGYSTNDGKGSVKDYYEQNSMGQFSPSFDVYGPVPVNSGYATYGANNSNGDDKQPELAFYEACQKLDNEIDFSQYDYDGDGDVDMILFYYAGYGEADYTDSKTIWPHQYHMMYSALSQVAGNSFDGKRVNRYFCTSELQYNYGDPRMAGIGTTCHEFAHSLGLPDFYDTNYSTDGSATATSSYDVMCDGAYNSTQTCPPYFNAEERVLLGWMDRIPDFPATGSVTINPIAGNVAFKSPTATDGEYFVYECRVKQDWDSSIPAAGLVVYHVDKSKTRHVTVYSSYSFTPYNLWTNWDYANAVNCNGSHPCFYIVPAANTSSTSYYGSAFAFGTGTYTTYNPKDWDGKNTLYTFSNIRYANNVVTLTVNRGQSSISGKVTDARGNAVGGASVEIASGVNNGTISVTTGSDGTYSSSLATLQGSTFTVTASADGYYSAVKTVTAGSSDVTADLVLRDLVDGGVNGIHKFDDMAENVYVDGFGAGEDIMTAVGFYPEELAPYVGRQIKSVSFAFYSGTFDSVHLVVDFGLSRALTLKVPGAKSNEWNTVDVTQYNLTIPSGKDCYFGYAVKNPSEGPILFDESPSNGGGLFYADYNLTLSNWIELEECNLLVSVELVPLEDEYIPFNTIDNPGNGVYNAGDTFTFRLNESTVRKPTAVSWFVDDDPVTDGGFVMARGKHLIEARITENGKTKSVQLEIEAK